jgi:hypothetical protein
MIDLNPGFGPAKNVSAGRPAYPTTKLVFLIHKHLPVHDWKVFFVRGGSIKLSSLDQVIFRAHCQPKEHQPKEHQPKNHREEK